jgi:sulfatase modifying factor 1
MSRLTPLLAGALAALACVNPHGLKTTDAGSNGGAGGSKPGTGGGGGGSGGATMTDTRESMEAADPFEAIDPAPDRPDMHDVAETGETGDTAETGNVVSGPASCGAVDLRCRGESCCESPLVPGTGADVATLNGTLVRLADFRLDKYEVTVGRFRQFLSAYNLWHLAGNPMAGAGAGAASHGTGWDSAWNGSLPAAAATLAANLQCEAFTWTDQAGAHEAMPLNCVTWYEAFAFCVWDGGRLATEVEWQYAASGGYSRGYPWGDTPVLDDVDATHAVYDCMGDYGTPGDCNSGYVEMPDVGSRPLGLGRWGQADLAGSMWEWVFDWYSDTYPVTSPALCDNCAATTPSDIRVFRGGGWLEHGGFETATYRLPPAQGIGLLPRYKDIGFRCARAP